MRRSLAPEDLYAEYEAEFAALIEAAWLGFKAEMEAGQQDPITYEQWLVDAEIDTDPYQNGWVSAPQPYRDWADGWFDSRADWNNYV